MGFEPVLRRYQRYCALLGFRTYLSFYLSTCNTFTLCALCQIGVDSGLSVRSTSHKVALTNERQSQFVCRIYNIMLSSKLFTSFCSIIFCQLLCNRSFVDSRVRCPCHLSVAYINHRLQHCIKKARYSQITDQTGLSSSS